MKSRARTILALARSQDGFTMILAIGTMLVASLLLVAAFTAANGDIHISHRDTVQKQAYYAALAGVQEYEYHLQANPDYWETCAAPKSTIPEEANASYEDVVLPASTAPSSIKECEASNPFQSAIESKGTLVNTFRIKATGKVKGVGYTASATRSIIATFKVSGFLSYIYFTNFETLDPGLYENPAGCEGAYYKEWSAKKLACRTITFTTGDSVNGPMHTNDAARVEGEATFGRSGQSPADAVEINGGTYPTAGCSGSAKYYTATKCYTTGATLIPPESDTTLAAYVESANHFSNAIHMVLNGLANTIKVKYFKEESGGILKETEQTLSWPENGLIYVQAGAKGCGYSLEIGNNDNSYETEHEKSCGNIYVEGTYSKSLTVAGESDVIITGNLTPTSIGTNYGNAPSGTAVLGLIASHYVRVYHPCSSGNNQTGSLTNPWIYAAILSTSHSFLVDNWECGKSLGELNVYGAIAQDYRGPVGTSSGSGYIKNYEYDGRLATDEPPYFLAPLKAGWKIIRETAPTGG